MGSADPETITLEMMRGALYSAVVADALDELGYRRQSPRVEFKPYTVDVVLIGRCKTTLWEEMDCEDPHPYEKELLAVDSCRPDDVFIAAAQGSLRSGVWGELLSTAASAAGCAGAIVDGAIRDVRQMTQMAFPVFARGTCAYDSRDRQRVVEYDVAVEIGDVRFGPGDLAIADADGVVVVPPEVESEAIRRAWRKVHDENKTRDAIRAGMKAKDAYDKFGVL